MTRIALIGATGRMGRAITRAAQQRPDIRIGGAIASAQSDSLGRDLGELSEIQPLGVKVSSNLAENLKGSDVAIDFSQPHATAASLAACRTARVPLLIGTTGIAAEELKADLASAAAAIPVLIAPNTSLAVTLLMELVRQAAQALPADFDIEITEAHHRYKKDAPSGTALALGRAAAQGRSQKLDEVVVLSRHENRPRRTGEIGFAVVRGGDIIGEHTVLFAGAGEQLALSHRATDRAVFARGALSAAVWLASRPPGLYSMADLLRTNA